MLRVSGFVLRDSDVEVRVCGFGLLVSVFVPRVSVFNFLASGLEFFCFRFRVSAFRFRGSDFELPVAGQVSWLSFLFFGVRVSGVGLGAWGF